MLKKKKTEVYALETANSSVQTVAMTNAEMQKIAERYMSTTKDGVVFGGTDTRETVPADAPEGTEGALESATLTITFPSDVKDGDTVVSATITYDPTPAVGHPRVELDPSWD